MSDIGPTAAVCGPAGLADKSAGAVASAIWTRSISATEVIRRTLARIAETNQQLLAFTEVYEDDALAMAAEIDRQLAAGHPVGSLAGVPVAIKDMTPLAGKRTTLGSLAYRDAFGTFDPVFVHRLRAAGAIVIGKTNTPEFAHAGFCSNRVFGTTRNPWSPERTPGGSSGGAGAAVAAGYVPIAEGTDMGGSVRIPAAFCGLVGLKPSLGRIPMDILPSVFDTISHFGPLTRTVEDAWRFLEATKGPDDADPFSLPQQEIAFDREATVKGMHIALSPDLGFYLVDDDVRTNLERTAVALQRQGALVEFVDIPWDHEVYQIALANWDVYIAAFQGQLLEEHRDTLDPGTVAMMERATALDAVTVKRYEFLRTRLWRDLSRLFRRYDALLCPTAPITAPPVTGSDLEYGHQDERGRTVATEMTTPFNFVPHCPAITVPSGLGVGGLPTAAQFVGRRFDEATVLRLARAVERTDPLDGHIPLVGSTSDW